MFVRIFPQDFFTSFIRGKNKIMEENGFCYDLWIEEALRLVIQRALRKTASEGLPGDHHFYVTFRTNAFGVEIPSSLRTQHPSAGGMSWR